MYQEAATSDIGTLLNCPFCNSHCLQNDDPRSQLTLYICPTCGKFVLGGMSNLYLRGLSDLETSKTYKISFALRSISERALGKRDNSFFPPYSADDLMKMLEAPEPSVQEKLILLLKYLGKISTHPGEILEFDSANDYTVACAKNYQEAMFYFESLAEQTLISQEQPFTGRYLPGFKVTAQGWQELHRIEASGSDSTNAFIAMSFHPDRNPYEKAISAAVATAGYRPIRVDQIEHVNRIDDEILARIRDSKFLISDFTHQRNGVYFEAGFMLGLGRPVIWICEKGDLKNVHFDTRQYNTIDYTDADDLRRRLQFRIEAILGKGPHVHRPPSA